MTIMFIYNCRICIIVYFHLLAIINKPIKTKNKKNKRNVSEGRPSSDHALCCLTWVIGRVAATTG